MSLIYRSEVDGLRCIAVLLVILNHLDIPGFSGGFVGVDVFFVISGYLITGIVLNELKSKSFSFGGFYKRRVIRLAPAYFVVLFTTTLVALLLMLPAEFEKFSVSALYSTFFAANFYMWDTVGGYFGSGADTTPLLHLWSLAVEEQFYMFWPVTLFLMFRFMRGYEVVAVILALALALAISEYGAINYRAATYYLMPTRAFELLMGAVLALVPLAYLARIPLVFRLILSGLGLALILYGNFFFTSATRFPGLNALFPCLGTFLLIAFVRANDPLLGSLLTNRIMVGIGKISYPAYLWHWPIIAFLNMQLTELTPLVSGTVVLVTLLLAAITYQLVEKPARRFRYLKWPKVVGQGFILPAALFGSAAVSAIQLEGMPGRFDEVLTRKSTAVLSYAYDVRGRCNEGPITSPLGPDHCILGAQKPGVDFLMVGDSHANHFTGMFDVLARDAGLRGYDVTQSQSPFLVDVDWYYQQEGSLVRHNNFSARNEFIKTELIPNNYNYVVLAGTFPSYYSQGLFSSDGSVPDASQPEVFRKAMVQTLELLVKQGSIPILIKGNPTFDFDISSCTLNNLRFDLDKNCNMQRQTYQNQFSDWSTFVDELENRFNSLIVVDPAKVMCDQEKCYSELEGVPLYKDSKHLNYKGSRLIGELYLKKMGNPFMPRRIETVAAQVSALSNLQSK